MLGQCSSTPTATCTCWRRRPRRWWPGRSPRGSGIWSTSGSTWTPAGGRRPTRPGCPRCRPPPGSTRTTPTPWTRPPWKGCGGCWPTSGWSGWGRRGWTTTTTTRPGPTSGPPSPPTCAWPASSTRPWSSTAGRRSPTFWPSWTARAPRRGWCSTASPATPTPPPGWSRPAGTCRSPACSPSATPPSCGPPARPCPWTGWCWRPTARSCPPIPSGAAPTTRPGLPSPPAPWPTSTGCPSRRSPPPPQKRQPRRLPCPSTAVAELAPRALLTPGRVRALLAAYDLRPSKALGQHYLADPNTARKVARLGGIEPGETVLEIGPGLGSLTLALREAGAAVVAVEADPRLLPALAEVLGDDPLVRVELADALKVDLAALAPAAGRLVANLPYNIAATLVLKVLAEAPAVGHLVVMVQREVGERLAAAPGSAAYGAPSAKLAAQASARVLSPVSRRVFVPEPRVDSVLLGVTRREHPAVAGVDQAELGRVVDAAFGQRRKTLRNALRGLGLDAAGVEALGRAAGVDLGLRAERLGVEEFAALTRQVGRRF